MVSSAIIVDNPLFSWHFVRNSFLSFFCLFSLPSSRELNGFNSVHTISTNICNLNSEPKLASFLWEWAEKNTLFYWIGDLIVHKRQDFWWGGRELSAWLRAAHAVTEIAGTRLMMWSRGGSSTSQALRSPSPKWRWWQCLLSRTDVRIYRLMHEKCLDQSLDLGNYSKNVK